MLGKQEKIASLSISSGYQELDAPLGSMLTAPSTPTPVVGLLSTGHPHLHIRPEGNKIFSYADLSGE